MRDFEKWRNIARNKSRELYQANKKWRRTHLKRYQGTGIPAHE